MRWKQRGAVLTFSAMLLIAGVLPTHAASGIPGSPKIVNPYLDWQIREADLPQLARWDVVILDADQQTRHPDYIRTLRTLNPSIKILAYVPTEEIATARFLEPREFPFGKLARQIQDEWYLRDPSGSQVFFWPGSPMLNVTNEAAVGENGMRWNAFLPHFIHDEILSTGLWDGVFLDNTFDSISPYAKSSVDLNKDGKEDAKVVADRAWKAGMSKMLRGIRTLDPSAILIGNGGHAYADLLDGAFFEHFPSWNWAVNWKEFRTSVVQNRTPSYSTINVNTKNEDRPNDYAKMRYGLANALIGGGMFSFDKGDASRNTLWWYDEYETRLGSKRAEPRTLVGGSGSAVVPAVWSRDFQNGIAILNSTAKSQRVPLPGVFEKLKGTQDPITNDGTLVRTVDLASHDGILLIRRAEPEEISGSVFENGTFVQIFDANGRRTQSGFFAQRPEASSGALILSIDLDRDARSDVITSSRGVVAVRTAGSASVTLFSPFGARFTGALSLASGNVNRDPAFEILTARETDGPPEVRLYSRAGALLTKWNAYRSTFRGGVRVAIGDLDGDGLREIVTGAGPGGGPHIRLWKTDGTPWSGGFFAFPESDHGGVHIAVGDVDGDGKDEIIAASGQGAVPRVRIFDGRGTLKREMTFGAKPLSQGLRVSVSDMNADGIKEILVSGLPTFE